MSSTARRIPLLRSRTGISATRQGSAPPPQTMDRIYAERISALNDASMMLLRAMHGLPRRGAAAHRRKKLPRAH